MSDILIRGMEMPKNCAECVCSKTRHSSLGDIIDCKRIGTVGSAFKDPYNILNNRHPDCPLFEIPAHGNLIDRDEASLKAQLKLIEKQKCRYTAVGRGGLRSRRRMLFTMRP